MASEKDSIFWVYDKNDGSLDETGVTLNEAKNYIQEQAENGYDAENFIILKEYIACECQPAKVTFNKI